MIKLIVGLGNPGKDYQTHRHNAGFWFVDSLATKFDVQFTAKSKFLGESSSITLGNKLTHLLKPKTFMNNSGGSIKSLANYYNIKSDEILVAHDELDLPMSLEEWSCGPTQGSTQGL